MFESQSTTPDQVSTDPLGEAVVKLAKANERIADLEAELTRSKGREQDYYEQITKARKHFEEILSGDIDAQQTYEDFQIPFELLGVDATREVQVTVTANWSGVVHLPYGTDLDDVCMSFTAEFDDLEGSVGWHADDYTIEEG